MAAAPVKEEKEKRERKTVNVCEKTKGEMKNERKMEEREKRREQKKAGELTQQHVKQRRARQGYTGCSDVG